MCAETTALAPGVRCACYDRGGRRAPDPLPKDVAGEEISGHPRNPAFRYVSKACTLNSIGDSTGRSVILTEAPRSARTPHCISARLARLFRRKASPFTIIARAASAEARHRPSDGRHDALRVRRHDPHRPRRLVPPRGFPRARHRAPRRPPLPRTRGYAPRASHGVQGQRLRQQPGHPERPRRHHEGAPHVRRRRHDAPPRAPQGVLRQRASRALRRAYERPPNASPTPVPAAVRVPPSTSSIDRPTRRARSPVDTMLTSMVARRARNPSRVARGRHPPARQIQIISPHLSFVVVGAADPSSSLLNPPIRIEPAGDRQLPRHGAWRSRDQEVRGR